MDDVTVVTAVRDGMPFLPAAVDSILNQTHRNLRYIVVDDGSKDGSVRYLQGLSDSRLVVLTQPPGGKATAMNRVLPTIDTPYWLIQDADDVAHPERVERQVRALARDDELGLVYAGWEFLTSRGRWGATWTPVSKAVCSAAIRELRPPGHDATMAFRTERTLGLRFSTELTVGQGLDFAFQVGERSAAAVVDGCLLTYRVHLASNTARHVDLIEDSLNTIRLRAEVRRGSQIPLLSGRTESTQARSAYRRFTSDLVPHTIESVLDHRRDRDLVGALSTAIQCVLHSPLSAHQYKPAIYAVTPRSIIDAYRRFARGRAD